MGDLIEDQDVISGAEAGRSWEDVSINIASAVFEFGTAAEPHRDREPGPLQVCHQVGASDSCGACGRLPGRRRGRQGRQAQHWMGVSLTVYRKGGVSDATPNARRQWREQALRHTGEGLRDKGVRVLRETARRARQVAEHHSSTQRHRAECVLRQSRHAASGHPAGRGQSGCTVLRARGRRLSHGNTFWRALELLQVRSINCRLSLVKSW